MISKSEKRKNLGKKPEWGSATPTSVSIFSGKKEKKNPETNSEYRTF